MKFKIARIYSLIKALDEQEQRAAECGNECHAEVVFERLEEPLCPNFALLHKFSISQINLKLVYENNMMPDDTNLFKSSDSLKNFVTFCS